MINEILELSRSLERCQLSVEKQHPWIKPLGRAETLIVQVGVSDGQVRVVDVKHCNREEACLLWKVEESNHASFPAVNMYGPLYNVDSTSESITGIVTPKVTPGEVAACIQKVTKGAPLADSQKDRKRLKELWTRLCDFPVRKLAPAIKEAQPEYGAFAALIEVFQSLSPFDASKMCAFVMDLVTKTAELLLSGRLDSGAELLRSLVLGKWNNRREQFEQATIPVFFDLADYSRLQSTDPIRITDARMRNFVSQRLLSHSHGSASVAADTGVCALTGTSGVLEGRKLPNPRLPLLGNTYLMSMDKNASCHDRYGLCSTTEVFPINRDVSRALSDALLHVTQDDRKGKTWLPVPSGRKKSDLLIAYVENLPDEDFENARLLGGTEQTADADFETVSSMVCDALKSKLPAVENQYLRMFVIRRISLGQAQLVLAERLTVSGLFDAVRRWKEGATNHPKFALRLPPAMKGASVIIASPKCPFPTEIVELLDRQWIKDGTDSRGMQGAQLGEVYEVFLAREKAYSAASALLRGVLERTGPLLLGIGRADHTGWRSESDRRNLGVNAREAALQAVSVLGILLLTLNRKKEEYMKGAPYYIGRMFALADLLHSQYCEHVRKGEVPNQLIGNAHLRIAMQTPAAGLARLEERLIIYKAWADKFTGDKAGLAKWCLREMGQVAEALAKEGIPNKMDDVARAEMLLGYLAHPEKADKQL